MTSADRAVAVLLRILGAGGLLAVGAVFLPVPWMAATHRWLGLGEMPTAPVVEYLARTVAAFYAFLGALCLVVASDPRRYRPLVRFLSVAFALLGVAFTGVNWAAGLPWWWFLCEGPPGVLAGAAVLILADPAHDKGGSPGDDDR
jgi:hypothetical protein